MKLRMYLRGLGIGIVVTALIMGLTTSKANKIPDSEIIKRAEALGMVKEDNTLKSIVADKTEEPEKVEPTVIPKEESKKEPVIKEVEEPKEELKEEPKEEPVIEETEEPKEEPKEEPVIEEVEEPKEVQKEETETDPEPVETAPVTTGNFTLEIAGGSGSETVSALLEKGGAVRSAAEFDEYLCNNGYDHRITAGKHIIPAGSDYETIAKIITSR